LLPYSGKKSPVLVSAPGFFMRWASRGESMAAEKFRQKKPGLLIGPG
jgi:hypothetical protein